MSPRQVATGIVEKVEFRGDVREDDHQRSKRRRSVRDFIIKYSSNRKALAGGTILGFFGILALLAPIITTSDPNAFVARPGLAPSMDHWFGTTASGQDVFAQTIWGTRVSLTAGLLVGTLTTALGALIGMSAGYFGGRIDDTLSQITNVVLIMPSLPLLITLAAFLPAGYFTIVIVLSLTGWAWPARVLRSQTFSLREKDFIASAEVSGENSFRIIFVELLPNMLSIVAASFIGSVTYGIGAQAGLEFIGLGDPSVVSWGTNLYWASNNAGLLTGAWWTFVPSGLCIALVAFALALLNYAIDEVTNPRLRSQRGILSFFKKAHRRLGSSRATPVLRESTGD